MNIDRTPAHLADMLGFVRELRNILAHGYERIDQQTLHRMAATVLAAVERELMACLATRARN